MSVNSIKMETHDNLAAQPSAIIDKLLDTPRLCMLLNPDLSQQQIQSLVDTFYVVDIEHEGEQRFAVVCGFYLRPEDETIEPQLRDMWDELAEEEEA